MDFLCRENSYNSNNIFIFLIISFMKLYLSLRLAETSYIQTLTFCACYLSMSNSVVIVVVNISPRYHHHHHHHQFSTCLIATAITSSTNETPVQDKVAKKSQRISKEKQDQKFCSQNRRCYHKL
ncbi:hypothetical protein Ahia01_000623000 [Argonauta hians]